jgi:hypothetical protein
MKMYYFGYAIISNESKKKYSVNVHEFIKKFIHYTNYSLKHSLSVSGVYYCLTESKDSGTIFEFTKSIPNNETLKKINKNFAEVDDVSNSLTPSETIGTSSYIKIDSEGAMFGYANTTSSPRVDEFISFMNKAFIKLGSDEYTIEASLLTEITTREDILEMEMVSSAYIKVDADRKLGRQISDLLFNTGDGIGSFTIKIIAKDNLKPNLAALVGNVTDERGGIDSDNDIGIQEIGVRAKKSELQGALSDLWLDSNTKIFDTLNPNSKTRLAIQIDNKFSCNEEKSEALEKYQSNNRLIYKPPTSLKNMLATGVLSAKRSSLVLEE